MQVLYRESESGLKGPNKDLKIEVKDKTRHTMQWKVKDKTGDVLKSRHIQDPDQDQDQESNEVHE